MSQSEKEFPNKTRLCNSWVMRAANGEWTRETYCETTARLFFHAGHDVVLASDHLAELNRKEAQP